MVKKRFKIVVKKGRKWAREGAGGVQRPAAVTAAKKKWSKAVKLFVVKKRSKIVVKHGGRFGRVEPRPAAAPAVE